MRSIPDHRDPPGRPVFKLDQFEAVITSLLANAVDQRAKMRKPALPVVLMNRHRLGRDVVVKHRQRDVDLGIATWRVKYTTRTRPIFDRFRAVTWCTFFLGFFDQKPGATVDQVFSLRQQSKRTSQDGITAVRTDYQIRLDAPPVR